MAKKGAANEINITRIYDAPVRAVWEAWTDPKQVAQWWGPRGFTITTHSKDVRTGGTWVFTMHGPGGVDFPNKIEYFEVDKNMRLVYDHGGNDDRPPMFRVTALFSEINGKTKLDMTMTLPTPEAAAETHKNIKKFGGYSTWDRLAEYLTKTLTGRDHFVINRSFDAPIDDVYDMWTNPKHFAKWMGPAGSTMEFIRSDIRPGGSSYYWMSAPGGDKMYGLARYVELLKPNLLVYTQQFVDEHEKISRHPFAPTWPETMLTKVILAEEGPGRTRITVIWEPHGNVTSEEQQTFVAAKAGMAGGWTGSFDTLETYLATQT